MNINESKLRVIPQFYQSELNKRGITTGDYMALNPVYGRRKTLHLKRTMLRLTSMKSRSHASVYLPVFKDEELDYELKLCSVLKSMSGNEDRGRFLLKSLNNYPFRVNGVICFESYI